MIYIIIGIAISIVLLFIGIICDITNFFIAGLVFFFCNIGSIIGFYLRKRDVKLTRTILSVLLIITVLVLGYVFWLHQIS